MDTMHEVRSPAWAGKNGEVAAVATYLVTRGLAADDRRAAHLFHQLLELTERYPERRVSVDRAARYFYVSRRALGRWCERAGLPSPSRILGFGRVLRAIRFARTQGTTLCKAAAATGWPDAFTLSGATQRLTGMRPSEGRRHGLIYVAEAWLQMELKAGHAELRSPQPPACPACGQHVTVAVESAEGGTDAPLAS